MGWPQREQTPIATDKFTAVGVANDKIKHRLFKAMDMRFYCCQDQFSPKRFCVYWKSGIVNLGDYYSKHHAAKHYQMVQPIYLNNNNSPREITINTAVVLRGYEDSDQGNAQSNNPNRLILQEYQ